MNGSGNHDHRLAMLTPLTGTIEQYENETSLICYDNTTACIERDMFHVEFRFYVEKYVISSIAACGILGNFLNLAILTRHQFKQSLSKLEKSAHLGLIALALSDLLVCSCLFPKIIFPKKYWVSLNVYSSKNFWYYWSLYSEAVVNTFIVWSTWLTVSMALSRYVALCHPMKARHIVGPLSTKAAILICLLFSILLNLPYIWVYECSVLYGYYSIGMSRFGDSYAYKIIRWLQGLFGTLLPIAILIVCNVSLAKTLQKSSALRRQCTRQSAPLEGKRHRITLTLVVIIIMYLVCVAPSRLMEFVIDEAITRKGESSFLSHSASIAIVVSVFNLAVSVNFAMNFILYCVVNMYFRKVLRGFVTGTMVCGKWDTHRDSRSSSFYLTKNISTFRRTSVETWM